MRRILLPALLLSILIQAAPATAQTAASASPEDVARGFYAFYLGELNRDNWEPLRKRREALKYLTPEFHRRVPRLAEKWLVNPIVCAQDWDKDWAARFTVAPARVRAGAATTVVTLPPFGGAGDAIQIKLTLTRRAGRWLINNVDCVM